VISDEVLALNLQNGDKGALATLVKRHHSPLIGYLYRMTNGNRALAEDMAQNAFVRVLRRIDSYIYPRPFKAWLYAIATNLIRDHFKSADARRAFNPAEMPNPTGPSPEGQIIAEDEAHRAAEALSALPGGQREAVILRYYQEFSLAEIADALDIPVGTVKSRLSLGLKRMRAIFEETES
jgi:RNA polymerase sigma-70 factor (ECF subfamily)